ncbi:YggS family pyridoxal phosphate-dependent enzyme [Buchnera aphidicola]|uniref:YggS family pyridoxal phosphate-dependent enzyme n=1 Tax=Buchnera aphidicola TaxID=9 RepID=UPI001F46F870|nr:YggS family pyridoxal phosphate-dependent enzyme [Buchnera aphidicola]WAI03403.1 MAG: YggS family pyridoxal phosphate-dependent enzyme [Buchnera aphidicola (Myzus persicae)]
MAATKNQNINIIKKAISIGIKEFGENYIQESIVKIQELKNYKNIVWHFIGKIQSKKTKIIAKNFDWCQTIDRNKIAILLNQYRPKNLLPINVLIQINISQEENKNGISIQDYQKLAELINVLPNLNLRGIMAMPEIKKNVIDNQIQYKKIKIIFEKLKKQYASIDTLSLGTSLDIKESLLAHSNMIRIGQSLFNR